MDRKRRADLLVVYKPALKLCAEPVRNLSGWAGDDFSLAFEKAERVAGVSRCK